ncbi:cyclic nucleotide-binding domain-containing protein [Pedobacter africanus]|uniref:cAMP-binding domain of CRP or a regulatory subunit of cAMP-dependent protein kinases n=1 Tax=Pedobacter africanus TaxID=151894 RepID=A0A1W2DIW2_9SPHI|nr:Crp/Fnr family transcriptional regulator [Pedobacter africanus]SMC97032.1 hypothetical protein SAMN04488524_3836 [Pedobacter africanus]
MNFDDILNNTNALKEPTVICFGNKKLPLHFLAEGHALEFALVNGKRKVIRFIDSGQFVFRFNLGHGIEASEHSTFLKLEWDKLVQMLKKFPGEIPQLHKKLKEKHIQDLKEYRADLKKTPAERYFHLLEKQPWVKVLATPEEIASYLNLSLAQYHNLTGVE